MDRQEDSSSNLSISIGFTLLEISCEAVANSLDQVVYSSEGQYEGMQIIIFCDRAMFVNQEQTKIPVATIGF